MAKRAGKDPSAVKIAMIYQDDAFSLDVRQGVVDPMKKYKMTAAIDDRMPKDLNDITSFLTKVKAVKADVLIVSGHEKGAATAARQMAELKIQVPLVGITHCESAKVTQDFPKASEDFVCPTQWDETMKIGDPLFGTAANYNTQIKAAYNYKVVPYQTAQASAARLRVEGRLAARQFARQGEGARGADEDRPRDVLRSRQVRRRTAAIPGKEIILRRSSTANTMSSGRNTSRPSKLTYPREAQY